MLSQREVTGSVDLVRSQLGKRGSKTREFDETQPDQAAEDHQRQAENKPYDERRPGHILPPFVS